MRTNARVYVMQADDGSLKIGHSADPDRRSRQLYRRVKVVYVTEILEHAEKIERLAHKVLALNGRHIHGEWFEASLACAIEAIETAVRQANGLELPLGGKVNYSGKQAQSFKTITVWLPASTVGAIDDFIRNERHGEGRRDIIIRQALRAFLEGNQTL